MNGRRITWKLASLARSVGCGRNSLRRRTDRIEGAAVLAAIVLALAAVPVATSAVAGTILLALMWFAEYPIARFDTTGTATSSTNPFIDYHVVYALALFTAGTTWGLGRQWAGLDVVRRNPWLR